MDFYGKIEIKVMLDILVLEKSKNQNKINHKSKAVIFAKTFDKLSGIVEPYYKRIQMNHIYRLVNKKCNYSTKEILKLIANTENKKLLGARNIANEILKDQEQLKKFQIIIPND